MTQAKHYPPVYRNYRGWTKITECSECGARALYEDRHTHRPCPDCGGALFDYTGKWFPGTKEINVLGLFKFTVPSGGEWKLREEITAR